MFRITTFFLFLLVLNATVIATPKKVALIIAIGNYPENSGWAKINSVNDVAIIKSALKHHQFRDDYIFTLEDENATKVNILKNLDDLYARVHSGDVVYFHFSGHGQQIVDDNGDEIDGLDESLVPYNAGIRYDTCPARGENHIRDDFLNDRFDKIRKKLGPNGDMIVVIDACHSGTATRNIGISRGTDLIFGQSEQLLYASNNPRILQGFIKPTLSQDLSPIVVFSGSSASEQNYEYVHEGKSYGSLSFAFSKVLYQLDPNSSYRTIFGKVQALMSSMVPRQNPQIEGKLDRLPFAGAAIHQMNHTTVKLWRNENSILLNAGLFNGINNKTIVGLYPIGTTNPAEAKPLSRGTVVNAQLSESLVILDEPLTKDIVEKSWVFILEYGLGNEETRVHLASGVPLNIQNSLKSIFHESANIKLVDQNPDILVDVSKENRSNLMVLTRDDRLLAEFNTSLNNQSSLPERILNVIKLHAQAQLLRTLQHTNERLRVSFEMIPVVFDRNFNEVSRSTQESKTNNFGQLIFNEGDFFKIRITNHGRRTAYYTLLDIQPDNKVNILIPEKDAQGNPFRSAADCKIEPGKTEELRGVFNMSAPFGLEVFKMVSSNRPLNLDQILVTRGQSENRNLLHPFEAIFAESFDMVTRSSDAHRLPPELIHIETLVFEIRPKE